MPDRSPSSFQVGAYRVDPLGMRVGVGEEALRVTPKVMEVLLLLAETPGQVVRREMLLDTIWADVVVTDAVLSRAISDLRKAFADSPAAPQYIETIPKVGYRLLAPVTPLPAPVSLTRDPAPPPKPELPHETAPVEAAEPVPARRLGPWIALGIGIAGLLGWALGTALPSGEAGPTLGQAVPLTTYPGRERRPVLDPGGARVAYLRIPTDTARADLFVQALDGSAPLRLTDTPQAIEAGPAWSPDGATLAFRRYTDDGCTIHLVPALGGPERYATACTNGTRDDLVWTPDGRHLVFSVRPETTHVQATHLVVYDLTTGQQRRLTDPPPASAGDSNPAVSPDGRTVMFFRRTDVWAGDLWAVPFGGGPATQRTHEGFSGRGLTFTPDGRHLVYSSNRNGPHSLWRIPATGGTPHLLVPSAGAFFAHPSVAGGHLVFEQWRYESNIWRTPLESDAAAAPLIASTAWDLQPTVSPDGSRIVFISTRGGHFDLWMAEATGANPQQLTRFGGTYVGVPRWAPGGQRVAFEARTGDLGRGDLYVLDVAAATPQRVTDGTANHTAPSWSPDGQWLYFGSDRSGRWEIWRMPADGSAPAEQLTTDGGIRAYVAADGQTLYYAKLGTPTLFQRTLPDGPETVLVGLEALRPDWWNWIATDEGIYLYDLARGPEGFTVLFFDFATQAPRPAATIDRLGFSPGVAVSPDGQWLYYTRVDFSESDVMRVAF